LSPLEETTAGDDVKIWPIAARRRALGLGVVRLVTLAGCTLGVMPVALLTNNGTLLREELATVSPEVAALGLPLHTSGDLGVAKPDPEVYRRVARLHGVTPAETLFVDDSPDYVDGARRAGLRAHLYTGYDAVVEFLVAEGVEV
jgi:glucose-1-phosphatase